MGSKKWFVDDVGAGGKRYEVKAAKKLKGHLVSRSGSGSRKGDMVVGQFIIEAKTSTKNSITIQKEWLSKVRKASFSQEKIPALLISFVTMNGDGQESWVAIPEYIFNELIGDKDED